MTSDGERKRRGRKESTEAKMKSESAVGMRELRQEEEESGRRSPVISDEKKPSRVLR